MRIYFNFISSAILLICLFIVNSGYAEEKILSFDSDIRINIDGSMVVTETIKVKAEGKQIKRGIYRDFPTQYKDRLGNNFNVSFNVKNLNRNKSPEPYHLKKLKNGYRVYFGSSSVFIEPSTHVYEFTYSTNRQIGFFHDFDELYWNVTGNGWDFTIDQASATIRLPVEVETLKMPLAAFTGYQGDKGKNFTSEVLEPGVSFFKTTRPLPPKHGLTTVTAWPKGIVKEPTKIDNFKSLTSDNKQILTGAIGLLSLLGYFLVVWFKFGKDPGAGVIYPRYQPPEGYGPDELRYIKKMGYDDKTFTAALVHMAQNGLIEIEEYYSKCYALKRKGGSQPNNRSARAIIDYLFEGGNYIGLDNENYQEISKAISSHKRSLARVYKNKYFYMNSLYLILGIVASIGVAYLTMAQTALSGAGPGMLFFVIIVSIVMCIVFYHLLKAPTKASRKILDEVDGFKEYMSLAEGQEIKIFNLTNAPELDVSLFEKYLPYAIALDVEQDWAKKFTRVFASLSAKDRNYSPSWYDGSSYNTMNISKFTSSLATSMNNTISASSNPPGTSSGGGGFSGGGGGSSGGGGGGGGGGGW